MILGMDFTTFLLVLLGVSETMALIPGLKSSGILDLILRILKLLTTNLITNIDESAKPK